MTVTVLAGGPGPTGPVRHSLGLWPGPGRRPTEAVTTEPPTCQWSPGPAARARNSLSDSGEVSLSSLSHERDF